MHISIDSNNLIALGLTISEYVYLSYLYLEKEEKNLYKIIDHVDEHQLQDKGFIKIVSGTSILRTKGINIFEGNNLFLKFLNTFPIKTPVSQRYLSPVGNTGIAVDKLEKKFNTLFKNKPHRAEKAIEVLEAELKWRKSTNQLEYIHNIEAWLNGSDYEKFAYLLESEQDIKHDVDLM